MSDLMVIPRYEVLKVFDYFMRKPRKHTRRIEIRFYLRTRRIVLCINDMCIHRITRFGNVHVIYAPRPQCIVERVRPSDPYEDYEELKNFMYLNYNYSVRLFRDRLEIRKYHLSIFQVNPADLCERMYLWKRSRNCTFFDSDEFSDPENWADR
jgi:hypothetical protein